MILDHIAFRTHDWNDLYWTLTQLGYYKAGTFQPFPNVECVHLEHPTLPGVFISEGPPGTIVGDWVEQNGEGIHHIAIRGNYDNLVERLRIEGEAIKCPGLTQIFSNTVGGVVIEILERDPTNPGFCEENVKKLMLRSEENEANG